MSRLEENTFAFPFVNDHGYVQKGLTKREAYAGMAMQALINEMWFKDSRGERDTNDQFAIAEEAFNVADAMIAQSKKGPEDA